MSHHISRAYDALHRWSADRPCHWNFGVYPIHLLENEIYQDAD